MTLFVERVQVLVPQANGIDVRWVDAAVIRWHDSTGSVNVKLDVPIHLDTGVIHEVWYAIAGEWRRPKKESDQ